MKKIKKIYELIIIDPKIIISYVILKLFECRLLINKVPPESYLKVKFYYYLHRKLDLDNPKSMNEKIQWLKLNDKNPKYIDFVDKYKVRDFIKNTIGEEYLIPLVGVWDEFEEIEIEKLPFKFVLKTTHDSGGVFICKNKNEVNYEQAKNKMKKSLNRNWYTYTKEWPYKNVKPRIIAEEFIEGENGKVPEDYKLLCYNGKVANIMVCVGRGEENTKFFFFDKEWSFIKYNKVDINYPKDFTLPKPSKLEEMIEVAEKISLGINFCRIDLYFTKNQVKFGEITFYPDSGFDDDITIEADYLLGEQIKLIEAIGSKK